MGFFSSLVGAVVGFFVGGPVGAVIGAGIGATKVGEKVVNTVMDFVLQPFMPKIPDIGNQSEAERQQGILVQTQGSTVNIPVVYGYRKVAGAVTFAETGSNNNKYLYVAYVFSEGLVEGLREVFIDDWLLPVDMVGRLNAGQLVNITSDKYKDRVQLRWFPGVYYPNPRNSTLGSTVKADIFAEAPSFTSNMNYNGLAVLFARYEWKEIKTQEDADSNPFTGGIPQIQISVLGKRIASLLVAAENFSYDSAPVRYSTNPAEILLDYLRNPRYGKGLSNNDIDWEAWKRSARKCNQTVTYVASGIQGPILTQNMVVDTAQTIMNNTKIMLQNFRAYMPYIQGKYKLKIEDAGNDFDIVSGSAVIVQTFTKDDIVSDITFNGIEKSSKYNVVSVTYVDPDQKWSNQQVIYPESEAERQRYIDLDGGRENKYEVTLGGITNYAIAKDFARLIFNKQRRQESCIFTATSKALELEPGDCIRIQSNILNFGTDPWRIVSFKVNNDMTVDLGCVRNPDDIYPYVRAGEEDIVLPTYVPKGSIIYYPSSQNTSPVGLVPPMFAIFPPSTAPSPNNPLPTDPNAPGGGGVGGGPNSGPEVTEPTTPPQVEVPPTNNAPVEPPKPPPFDAVLEFKRTIYTKVTENSGLFTLVFTQPTSAVYDYSILWWRLNDKSPYSQIRLDTKPGPGGEISANLGQLPRLSLTNEYYVRSYATNGDASSRVLKGTFRAVENQSRAGEFVGLGSGNPITVQPGWTVPASQIPTEPWYDDEIAELAIRPKLSAGVPQNPRRMTLTMTQIIYTSDARINPDITGVYVYYKYKDDVYWLREDLALPADYYPGAPATWDLAGDFGSPAYPLTGVDAINSPTIFQRYDFVVRLKYADGTTAKKQLVGTNVPVEINVTGENDFISMGTFPNSSVNTRSVDIPSGYTIPLLSQQNPATVYNTAQDLLPNFFSITTSVENKIFFRFNPPTNNSFRGYRIRYREIVPGADPDFKVVDIGKTAGSDNKIFFELSGDYRHSTRYQWMITVRYFDKIANTEKEGNNGFYSQALIRNDVPSGTNLVNSYFNFETKDTKSILNLLSDAFPAPAALIAQKWVKRQLVKDSSTDNKFLRVSAPGISADVRLDDSNQARLNSWYEFQFQAPNQTFTSLIIYRRVFSASGVTRTTVTASGAKYYNLGPWEKVTVPRTSLTHIGSGVYNVAVRGPINFNVFDPNYQVSGFATRTLFAEPYHAPPNKFPYKGAVPFLELMYPYYGLGNNRSSGAYQAEFLFVLDDGGEGAKALRVTEFYTDTFGDATTAGFKTSVDGFVSANIAKDNYVNISDYNSFDAGFSRNINEALTNITTAQLAASANFNAAFPRVNSSWTNWNDDRFLANPSGITVY
jgi:hypothetical protein